MGKSKPKKRRFDFLSPALQGKKLESLFGLPADSNENRLLHIVFGLSIEPKLPVIQHCLLLACLKRMYYKPKPIKSRKGV